MVRDEATEMAKETTYFYLLSIFNHLPLPIKNLVKGKVWGLTPFQSY